MPEETDPETQDVEWVSLTEAFNEIGRVKFGADWDKSTIYLSQGRFRTEMCDEELPLRIDYSIKHNLPEYWREYYDDLPHEHPIASEEMLRHYDETEGLLLSVIWDRKINVEAITSDGELSEVPRKAWKDTTNAFEISFPDSEVHRFKPKDSTETWRIRVNLNDLRDCLTSDSSYEGPKVNPAPQEPPSARAGTAGRFPSPPNLRWEEITITYFQNDAVKIKARDVEGKYTFAEMGFKDGRKGDAPNSKWNLLREGFAVRKGAITWDDEIGKKVQDNLKKSSSDIARTLRTFFDLKESPFHRYRLDRGYLLKLNLLDQRNFEHQERMQSGTGLPSSDIYDNLEAQGDSLLDQAQADSWPEEDIDNGRVYNPSKDREDF